MAEAHRAPIDGAFHFVGIGGAGMSVVAELFAARGAQVSGSDQSDSQVLARLHTLGVRTFVGHDAAHVPPEASLVISSAIRDSNPELAIAKARGQNILHRSEALALAAQGMRFVAVAGAHGKTTTSGMLASALRAAGLDPSVAVGGVIPQFNSGAHKGAGDIFVAEADESDGSFLNYTPCVEIVTNVEPDHLDRYENAAAFEEVFLQFSRRLTPGGLLICCAEDAGAARLACAARAEGTRVLTYGRPDHCADAPDVSVSDVASRSQGVSAVLSGVAPSGAAPSGTEVQVCVELRVPGLHNILNATAAWIAGVECGVEPQAMACALASFTGTSRRFELRGQVGDRRVFDDYAHHPTEVGAAIDQARVVAGDAMVVVVFQPHLFSRTQFFASEFAAALSKADRVVIADIYAAREDPQPGVTSALIADKVEGAVYVPDMHEAARCAARQCAPGGIVITMGAGSITQCVEDVVDEWRAQVAQ